MLAPLWMLDLTFSLIKFTYVVSLTPVWDYYVLRYVSLLFRNPSRQETPYDSWLQLFFVIASSQRFILKLCYIVHDTSFLYFLSLWDDLFLSFHVWFFFLCRPTLNEGRCFLMNFVIALDLWSPKRKNLLWRLVPFTKYCNGKKDLSLVCCANNKLSSHGAFFRFSIHARGVM